MRKQQFRMCRTTRAAIFVAILLAGVGTAAADDPPCKIVGVWLGQGDTGFTWTNVITAGPSATSGQLDIQWTVIDPTLFGFFPEAVQVTNARGVWKKVNGNTNKVTWIAYGLDASGGIVYTGLLSGTDVMEDCDHLSVNYVLEIFLPGQDMSVDPPFFCAEGTGSETRLGLAQSTCEQ